MRRVPALALCLSLAFLAFLPAHAFELTLNNVPVQVYFSPNGGCTEAIVREIGGARQEILVQAYSFTSVPIAKAFVDAFKRGVKVQAILDKSQRSERYTSATFLANSGIPTFIDDAHAIAHNKIIIDQAIVITGSFNFTKAAEAKNAENLLILKSKDLAMLYIQNCRSIGNIPSPISRGIEEGAIFCAGADSLACSGDFSLSGRVVVAPPPDLWPFSH